MVIPFQNTVLPSEIEVVTVIQARLGSSRLPGKVFLPLLGKPLLIRMAERVQAAKWVGKVVIATTTLAEDDEIEKCCAAEGFQCFRGDPEDLLERHYQVGLHCCGDAIVKIPSDCPLIDPSIIDRVLRMYLQNPGQYDYVSNLHPPSYPDGNDVEIIAMEALSSARKEARKDFEREHTTPFIWENPERFRLGNVRWEKDLDYSMSHRWTIDYKEDYAFIKTVYEALFSENPLFGVTDILALLKRNPGIEKLNQKYTGVNWYRHHLDQLKTVSPEQTRF